MGIIEAPKEGRLPLNILTFLKAKKNTVWKVKAGSTEHKNTISPAQSMGTTSYLPFAPSSQGLADLFSWDHIGILGSRGHVPTTQLSMTQLYGCLEKAARANSWLCSDKILWTGGGPNVAQGL